MAKRTTFYVMADLFNVPLSPMAKLVLVYLSRCCNRQNYLISCLYNAPMDCMVNARRAL